MRSSVVSFNESIISDYISNPDRYVYPFTIKEKNGKERTIITYNKFGNYGLRLRSAHESITKSFEINFAERNNNSFAYHKNVRCYDALQSHLKSNIFIKLDIHHFFESISEDLFFSIYGEYFNKDWERAIRGLFYKGSLSIGFVSSPLISDFFMKKFDKDIEEYLLNHPELHYSRYSDDILLSSELDDDKSLNDLFAFVKKELAIFKLEINDKKTRRITLDYDKHNSISYLGLNISKLDYLNNKITISKRYILFLLFLIEKQKGYTDHCYPLENEIKSRIAYLAYNSPISYQRFQKKHINKYGEPYSFTPKELDKRSASNVVNEIPNFEKYSQLFKINIHKKVKGQSKDGFIINDAIEIEEYIGKFNQVVEIPYFVDSIGDGAFSRYEPFVEKIVINEKLKSIGKNAFTGLVNLKEINLPKALRYIGRSAFERCSLLEKIIIPDNVKRIESSVFSGCRSLEEVILSNNLKAIMSHAFEGTNIRKIVFPDSLKEIQDRAFADCHYLNDIYLATSKLEVIDSYAFSNCSLLREVILPNTLLTLGRNAFQCCTSLRKVYISSSVLEIGLLPFYNCPILTSIEVDKDNKIYVHRDDNTSIIDNNGNLLFTIKETIDDDVKSIDYGVFSESFIKNITIPEGVKSIAENAFNDCKWLKTISLPQSLESIGPSAFSGCISLKEIVLPEKITAIPNKLFNNCSRLAKVSMSSEVTVIKDYAFSNCINLVMDLPKKLEVIGKYAFENCLSFKNLYIPSRVKKIKRDAFKGLNRILETIKVDPLNTTFSSGINSNTIFNVKKGVLLMGCKNPIIDVGIRTISKYAFAYCDNLKEIALPNTVQKICDSAFKGCKALEKVDLNTVNTIEKHAFDRCSNLKEIVFPNSLTSIGDSAFNYTALKKVILPESLTSFGKLTFANCLHLEEIFVPATFGTKNLDDDIFKNCFNIKHIRVSQNSQEFVIDPSVDGLLTLKGRLLLASSNTVITPFVRAISAKAFSNNIALEKIVIPDTVSIIEQGAFANCVNLKEVKMLSDIETIPMSLFDGCINLKKVNIPSGVSAIAPHAFKKCYKLKKITLPQSIKNIGRYAFANSAIENIKLPNMLESIGNGAFANCKELKHIVLPNSLKLIGDSAFINTAIEEIALPPLIDTLLSSCFKKCENLKNITLNNIKYISTSVFEDCTSLEEIDLNNVIDVSDSAFSGCSKLRTVKYPHNATSIPCSCFKDCVSLETINFPNKLENIHAYAFENCQKLIIPPFPESLKSIDSFAFANNKNIKEIYLPKRINVFYNSAFYNCDIKHIKVDKNNKVLFDEDKDIITYFDKGKAKHLLLGCKNSIIPDDVEIIDTSAFVNVGKIKNFRLPSKLRIIGAYAFANDDLKVKELIFPDSLESIVGAPFENCQGIETIRFNESLKKFGVFNYSACKRIYFPASFASTNATFNDEAIIEVSPLSKARVLQNGKVLVDASGNVIFTNKNADLPKDNECLSINWNCYSNRQFDKVIIPEGTLYLSGFNNCSINELVLPKSLKEIHSFAANSIIKKITVNKDNPYFITEKAGKVLLNTSKRKLYYSCNGFIPEGVTDMANDAINHDGIDEITIPSTMISTVISLDPHLYKEVNVNKDNPCLYSLDSAIINPFSDTLYYINNGKDIPNVVKRIASGAFAKPGKAYDKIYIPKSVKYIGRYAFDVNKPPMDIEVSKDNPVFDSRDNCHSLIISENNVMIMNSLKTTIPDGVICFTGLRINKEKEETMQKYSDGNNLINEGDLPF